MNLTCKHACLGEFCPPYPWSIDCLGPSGDWSHWTIQEEKLYFFWFAEAKEKFLANSSYYITVGSNRWNEW